MGYAEALLGQIPLKRNRKLIQPSDFQSLGALLFPPLLFGAGLCLLFSFDSRFSWLRSPAAFPVEMWFILFGGIIATLGGIGDWIFHRLYVTAGINERRSHVFALATGGVPLAILMSIASVIRSPAVLLVPILVCVLYTTAHICYDEFVFHRRRCIRIENALHYMTVFGNGAAWLAWMNWCFVRGIA